MRKVSGTAGEVVAGAIRLGSSKPAKASRQALRAAAASREVSQRM
jgi:hypothetical protein